MATLLDPAIMGGVFAIVIGAFRVVEKSINKKNGSTGTIVHEAEWRGEITQILRQQVKTGERQIVLLEQHCDSTKDANRLLEEVHEQICGS